VFDGLVTLQDPLLQLQQRRAQSGMKVGCVHSFDLPGVKEALTKSCVRDRGYFGLGQEGEDAV
jgi:hypothetical protein